MSRGRTPEGQGEEVTPAESKLAGIRRALERGFKWLYQSIVRIWRRGGWGKTMLIIAGLVACGLSQAPMKWAISVVVPPTATPTPRPTSTPTPRPTSTRQPTPTATPDPTQEAAETATEEVLSATREAEAEATGEARRLAREQADREATSAAQRRAAEEQASRTSIPVTIWCPECEMSPGEYLPLTLWSQHSGAGVAMGQVTHGTACTQVDRVSLGPYDTFVKLDCPGASGWLRQDGVQRR